MKRHAIKTCDLCGVTVAEKYFLRYVTVRNFVTMRGDEPTKYLDDVAATVKVKRHYCNRCWDKIEECARSQSNE